MALVRSPDDEPPRGGGADEVPDLTGGQMSPRADALIERYLGPGVHGGNGTAWSLSSPDRYRLVYLHTSRNGQQTATIFDTARTSHLGSRTISISGPSDLRELERALESLTSPPAP